MTHTTLDRHLAALGGLETKLYNRDFLITWEHALDEIKAVLHTAQLFKEMHAAGLSLRAFDSGLAISIFRDQSTRTRFSFASAVNALGLGLSELDEARSQIAHGETVRETANMISFLTEAIGIRDDIFLGEGNRYMREVAAAVQEGFVAGILPQRPAVINLQCDIDHPTQTLADLLHLQHHFAGLDKLRRKKFVISWAYSPSYGKPLSVPQGLIGLLPRFGMDVVLAHPPGYDLIPAVLAEAKTMAAQAGSSFSVSHDMRAAFQDADVVYPKSWAPYHIMEQRTALLKKSDSAGLKTLEKECLANNARFTDWECDEAKMKTTARGKALYMHCLPADISGLSCQQGEVSDAVFQQYRLATYHEASYKPFVIAALIFLTRTAQPLAALQALLDRAGQRHLTR